MPCVSCMRVYPVACSPRQSTLWTLSQSRNGCRLSASLHAICIPGRARIACPMNPIWPTHPRRYTLPWLPLYVHSMETVKGYLAHGMRFFLEVKGLPGPGIQGGAPLDNTRTQKRWHIPGPRHHTPGETTWRKVALLGCQSVSLVACCAIQPLHSRL